MPRLERILICPDVHFPFESKSAWATFLRAGRVFKPDRIVILGDFIDALSLSGHDPDDITEVSLRQELEAAMGGLDQLESLKAKHLHFIEGNHSQRLSRYLARNAPAVFGMLTMPKLLELERRGWEWIPYRKTLRIGKLNLTHDTGKAGSNAHRSAATSYMGSAVIGHTHRMAYEVRGRIGKAPYLAAMFGWLGDPAKVSYTHEVNAFEWVHGFGLGWHDTTSGIVHIQPVPIVDGKACILGKLV